MEDIVKHLNRLKKVFELVKKRTHKKESIGVKYLIHLKHLILEPKDSWFKSRKEFRAKHSELRKSRVDAHKLAFLNIIKQQKKLLHNDLNLDEENFVEQLAKSLEILNPAQKHILGELVHQQKSELAALLDLISKLVEELTKQEQHFEFLKDNELSPEEVKRKCSEFERIQSSFENEISEANECLISLDKLLEKTKVLWDLLMKHIGLIHAFEKIKELMDGDLWDRARYESRKIGGYRCGYPMDDILVRISDMAAKIYEESHYIEDLEGSEGVLSPTALAFLEKAKNAREVAKSTKEIFEKLDTYLKEFENLCVSPIENRDRVVECFDRISAEVRKIDRSFKYFTEYFLFNRLRLYTGQRVFYGVGTKTGVNSEIRSKGEQEFKTAEQYAHSIILRIDHGVRPVVSEHEYNCCPKLPAVFAYSQIGKWQGFAYFELNPAVYPVFLNRHPHYSAGRNRQGDELMIYTQEDLPIVNYNLIFYPDNNKFVHQSIADNMGDYMRKVIRHLPDVTPGGNEVIFWYKGNQYRPSEFNS